MSKSRLATSTTESGSGGRTVFLWCCSTNSLNDRSAARKRRSNPFSLQMSYLFLRENAMPTQAEKGETFYNLHHRDHAFIIPNPWDIGTARLLAYLGFEALATTSAGYAFSIGQPDGTLGREKSIAHAAAIVSATDLPV